MDGKQAKQAPDGTKTYGDSGSPEVAQSTPVNSRSSNTILRDITTGRAFQPGRPRVSRVEQLQKARERVRSYRDRRRRSP